ncbi:MAG: hypothetical protein R3E42_11665 [Burkholderiaceae bacterium]
MQLDADQVIVTTGTQQSLERMLADHGDTVWVEDPAYWGALKAFMASAWRSNRWRWTRKASMPTPPTTKPSG